MSPRRPFDSFARASARGPGGRPGTGEVSAGAGSAEALAGGSSRDGSGSGGSGGGGSAEGGSRWRWRRWAPFGSGYLVCRRSRRAGGSGGFVPARRTGAGGCTRFVGPRAIRCFGGWLRPGSGRRALVFRRAFAAPALVFPDPGKAVRFASDTQEQERGAEEQTAALAQMLRHFAAPAPGRERPFQSHPQPFRGLAQRLRNPCRLAERLGRAAERRTGVRPQPAVSLPDALRQVRPPAQEATEPGARLGEPAADEIETEGLLGRRLFGRSRIAAEIESCHEGRAYRSLQSVY